MKKLIVNILLAIIITIGFSTFASAQSNLQIKSAINTSGYGLCIDVAGGQTTEGTPVVQYNCHSGANQRFTIQDGFSDPNLRLIRSELNRNMCVGITNNFNANSGDLLRLVPCTANGAPRRGASWTLSRNLVTNVYRFRAYALSADGKNTCIDVPAGSNSPSLWLQIYYCNSGTNQDWRF